MREICIYPGCKRKIPSGRFKQKRITCSKLCSNAWNHLPLLLREELRGKKYKHHE